MKYLTLVSWLSISIGLFAQAEITGRYQNYFSSSIQLNPNHTFKYEWSFDMVGSWTQGTWILKSDTIYFYIVPVYDTLRLSGPGQPTRDSLVLSLDKISERIVLAPNDGLFLFGGGQNQMPSPDKLLFRKGRLYTILNGKVVTKKQKALHGKKRRPWFFKIED